MGCKRSYHLSCLDPPFEDVPLGVWHCPTCVMKKMESGVHSVSEGIESIWDTREMEVPDDNGIGKFSYSNFHCEASYKLINSQQFSFLLSIAN